jgi:hypothetical protein
MDNIYITNDKIEKTYLEGVIANGFPNFVSC